VIFEDKASCFGPRLFCQLAGLAVHAPFSLPVARLVETLLQELSPRHWKVKKADEFLSPKSEELVRSLTSAEDGLIITPPPSSKQRLAVPPLMLPVNPSRREIAAMLRAWGDGEPRQNGQMRQLIHFATFDTFCAK
jgi:hypothetical protein